MLDDPIDVLNEDVVTSDDHFLLFLLLLGRLNLPLTLFYGRGRFLHLKLNGLPKDWSFMLLILMRAGVRDTGGESHSSGCVIHFQTGLRDVVSLRLSPVKSILLRLHCAAFLLRVS